MSDQSLTVSINGQEKTVDVAPLETLLTTLREKLRLTGAKRGCNQGVCGACTVLVDGKPTRSCLSITANCTDTEITTIEGLAPGKDLTPVQAAMIDKGAIQCGFCSPGMVISAHAFLQDNPKPSIDDIRRGLSGNLCRCSGYQKIVEAVASAAEATS